MKKRNVFLPFSTPTIERAELDEVWEVMESGWMSTGPRTEQFETQFADYVGAAHAVGLNSCTGALHLALLAHGIGPGDEVLVPSFTFVSTVSVICHVGATPVFVDIDPQTWCVDAIDVERKITTKTKALIVVHYGGMPAAMDHLGAIADAHNLVVIEDAAHAVGSEFQATRIGGLGNTTCFSFYPTKTITTGEGGMLTTADDAVADYVRVARLHGISKDGWKRYSQEGSFYYDVSLLGWKYNMTDLHAAIGMHQLGRIEKFIRRRAALASLYTELLGDLDVGLPDGVVDGRHSWHLYPVVMARDTRDDLVEYMKRWKVGVSVHFLPVHLMTYYRKRFGTGDGLLPVTEDVAARIVSLPLYPAMQDDDVYYVVEVLRGYVASRI